MRSMFSDHQMADLAGNGFAVTASMVIDIAIFLSIKPVETDTNDVASSDPCSYLLQDHLRCSNLLALSCDLGSCQR